MDTSEDTKEFYKNKVNIIINEIKQDDQTNDEEIIRILQSNFINNNYSDSETSNLDTVSINTSPSSERYYSLSNNSSSDKLSNLSRDCEQSNVCAKLAKYFLKTCFCLDDD